MTDPLIIRRSLTISWDEYTAFHGLVLTEIAELTKMLNGRQLLSHAANVTLSIVPQGG